MIYIPFIEYSVKCRRDDLLARMNHAYILHHLLFIECIRPSRSQASSTRADALQTYGYRRIAIVAPSQFKKHKPCHVNTETETHNSTETSW
jgi:hypothetical protein